MIWAISLNEIGTSLPGIYQCEAQRHSAVWGSIWFLIYTRASYSWSRSNFPYKAEDLTLTSVHVDNWLCTQWNHRQHSQLTRVRVFKDALHVCSARCAHMTRLGLTTALTVPGAHQVFLTSFKTNILISRWKPEMASAAQRILYLMYRIIELLGLASGLPVITGGTQKI